MAIRSVKGLQLLGLTAVYAVAGKVGLTLAVVHASATAVWPPTGIALAALLILGRNAWPAIFLGAFLVNVSTAGNAITSAGIALGNTLEAVLGAALVTRWAGGRRLCDRPRDVVRFALFAAGGSTAVAATVGVTTLSVAGFAAWAAYGPIWFTWWLGDAAGALVVAPVLLLWANQPRVPWRRREAIEAAGLLLSLLVAGELVFGGMVGGRWGHDPLEFVCLPLLLWAAFRFGAREAATAVLLLAAVAIHGTMHGTGPFAGPSTNRSLLLLQAFMAVTSLMTLTVAAVISRRRRAERWLRGLSSIDPLTGLGNYRQLMEVLEREMARSGRTGRSFALVLLDLDGLKKINDRHGHLVGSQALRRVADVLRATGRAVDTAARFGGDEFAVVLPEADADAAHGFAERIIATLAERGDTPPVTVSVGLALYPRDASTIEALFEAADRELYADKARRGRARRR
ncbi:MAG TPA: MASE1 domain-containing protein [Gemmatimonadales bacterium]|nr:MASE1 domain-containing protein [Gemmatimonadales bacterium]